MADVPAEAVLFGIATILAALALLGARLTD